MKPRNDDFKSRRAHLEAYDDEALRTYFFELADCVLDPVLRMANDYTTPAIERSVLMRMGFSSAEAKALTERFFEHDLLSHGAGHVVYRYAKDQGISLREAGERLLESDALEGIKEVFKG
ncbi:MAG: D-ornithine 4,5-aminomutase subunit OraS [Acholeplasmataceae bacterium]